MTIARRRAISGAYRPIQFVSKASNGASSSTSVTINKPSNIMTGDFMLMHAFHTIVTAQKDLIAPSGWQLLERPTTNDGTFFVESVVYYKRAESSEPADYTFTFDSGNDTVSACILAYRNVSISNAIHDYTTFLVNSEPSGSDSVYAPSITTTIANTVVLHLFGHRRSVSGWSWINGPSGETVRESFTTGQVGILDSELVLAAPTSVGAKTITVNENFTSSRPSIGFSVALSPA